VTGEVGRQGSRHAGDPAPSAPKKDDAARVAGRGFMVITGAKVVFMVMGTAVTIGMPLLGLTPEQFGDYNTIIAAVSLLNMVVITGTLQAVAKLVSETPGAAGDIVRRAALLQLGFGVPVAGGYVLCAPLIADAFSDPSLTPLLRVSGIITLAYAFYAVFVGYFNGKKSFGRQAALDATFSTTKSILMLGLVIAGFGVAGAVWGFAAAASLIVFIALALFLYDRRKVETKTRSDAGGRLVGYLLTIMFYTFCIYGVLRADLFIVRALSAAGVSSETGALMAGIYGGIQYMARLPFQAVIAVTFVVFPLISAATFNADVEATRGYIRSTLRYSLILTVLLSALVAGNASELVSGMYGPAYVEGVLALQVLSVATVGYSLFYIATTMITGAGQPVLSAAVAFVTLLATAIVNYVTVDAAVTSGASVEMVMVTGAVATAASMLLGFGGAVGVLLWKYKAGLPWLTAARVSTAGVVVAVLCGLAQTPASTGRVLHLTAAVGKGAVAVAVFIGLLVLMRELGADDIARVKRVVGRKAK
jgi:O-antigen/teichoic acid export membrane protein